MQNLLWLDNLSYPFLFIAAIFIGLAPFVPKPHLVEKLIMLKKGELKKPIDIFDLFYHLIPIIFILLKILRESL